MSLQSPLGRVLGLGSAKDGTSHWWAQRVSSIGLLLLGTWFLLSLLQLENFAFASVVAFIARPWNSILLILLVGTIAYHSKLGLQVVIEDYVSGSGLKVVMLLISGFAHVVVAFAAAYSILLISLGAGS
jgi:succinate dehydrogenase / fumarate reductase membrane anchor subunit